MVKTLAIPLFSTHVRERFAERFPEENILECYVRSERVSSVKLLSWAKHNCQKSSFIPLDEYRHDAETNCLFVISSLRDRTRPTVVTVWKYLKPPRKKRR